MGAVISAARQDEIAVAIALLLAVVATSYQQTIHAYPTGGGSYTVTRANLGDRASLVAAAALLIDYVLTVAVSIAAGVAAITSALPGLLPYRVSVAAACIVIMAIANLRGVRESGRLFAVPTYFFIAAFALLLVVGIVRLAQGDAVPLGRTTLPTAGTALTWVLILRAFASGCTALTGVEAISNGVPAFREPESYNAAVTMRWMAAILATLFLGITVLAWQFAVIPVANETVVSQLARGLLGAGPLYYVLQAATALILGRAWNSCPTEINASPQKQCRASSPPGPSGGSSTGTGAGHRSDDRRPRWFSALPPGLSARYRRSD